MNECTKKTYSLGIAWRNIVILTVLFSTIYALPNFVILPQWLAALDNWSIALWMSLGFTVSGVILLIVMLLWLRHDGITLAEIGWGRRSNLIGVILGLGVGAGWLIFSWMGIKFQLPQVDVSQISLVRILAGVSTAFAGGVVEEIALRGLVMEWLQRAGVATWAQIISAGFGCAIYHSLHNLAGFPFSLLIGCLWAVVYIAGKRSLTPCIISHGIVDLLGEPYLLMLALVSS